MNDSIPLPAGMSDGTRVVSKTGARGKVSCARQRKSTDGNFWIIVELEDGSYVRYQSDQLAVES